MAHFMIDIETLDTAPTSVITEITCSMFHINSGQLVGTVTDHLDVFGQILKGRTTNDLTIEFRRNHGVSEVKLSRVVTLMDALIHLSNEIMHIEMSPGGHIVWCKGGSFDFSILRNAFEQEGLPIPWMHYNEYCCRALMNGTKHLWKDEIEFEGNKHDSLADVRHQAKVVSFVSKKLGLSYEK